MNNERIPEETLAKARRKFARHLAAVIMQAMSDTDTSFTEIAVRIGKTEKTVRGWIDDLMDGEANLSLTSLSDVCWAMGCRPKVTLIPNEEA